MFRICWLTGYLLLSLPETADGPTSGATSVERWMRDEKARIALEKKAIDSITRELSELSTSERQDPSSS